MYTLNIFCNDLDGEQYWERGLDVYETYDKALIGCYENALHEAQELMMTSDGEAWFEVSVAFEVTEAYETETLKDVSFFPVATVYYDHAPWDRENDCEIRILTGYDIVEVDAKGDYT